MSYGKLGAGLAIASLGLFIFIAVGLWTWPTPSHLPIYGEANPENSSYRPGGHQCEPQALAAIGSRRKRLSKTDDCAEKAEIYRQQATDLVQQARAADAAKAQADIAAQQLKTGWIQTLGGILTLAAAVGAAIYARAAAMHTRDANQLAKDHGIRNVRPYLFYEAGKIVFRKVAAGKKARW